MELDPSWRSYTIPTISSGLNTAKPDYEIEDSECSAIENIAIRQGKLITDTGYVKVGAVVRGIPKGAFVHETAAGATTLILITDATVYRYISARDEWHYISDGVDTTLTLGEAGGVIDLDVADTAGFAAAQFVGVELDTGGQHQTTVASIPTPGAPGVIRLAVALPSAAAAAKPVVKAVDLTGGNDDQVVFSPVPSHEWTVFTNGIDRPRRYDGSTCEVIPGLPSGGDLRCKTLTMFRDAYLILLNLTEAGVRRPYKMIWCSAGDPTTWTGGDSGDNSLVDSRDPIVAARQLGPYLWIYRRESFVRVGFQGLPTRTFDFKPVNFGETSGSQGVGCVAPNAVFAFTDYHVVASAERIWVNDGSGSVITISDPIFVGTFDIAGDSDRSKVHRSFFFYVEQLDELYFCYPSSSATFCNRAAVVSLTQNKIWRKRKFGHEMTAAGSRLLGAGEAKRIVDLVGTIAQQTWRIAGTGLGAGTPNIILCGLTPLQVYEYDLSSPKDDTLDIPWFLETKNFRGFDRYIRHDMTALEVLGSATTVSRFKKETATFEPVLSTPITTIKRTYKGHKQFISEGIKYRIFGSAAGVEIGPITAHIREESMWTL